MNVSEDESSPGIRVPFLSHWYVRLDPVRSAEHCKVRFVPLLTGPVGLAVTETLAGPHSSPVKEQECIQWIARLKSMYAN